MALPEPPIYPDLRGKIVLITGIGQQGDPEMWGIRGVVYYRKDNVLIFVVSRQWCRNRTSFRSARLQDIWLRSKP